MSNFREIISMADVLLTDDEFKENLSRITVSQYNNVLDVIYRCATGDFYDEKISSNGQKILKRISCADIIRAAKIWKEMTLDKVISDKKTLSIEGKTDVATDYIQAIKEIEAAIFSASNLQKSKKIAETIEAEVFASVPLNEPEKISEINELQDERQ